MPITPDQLKRILPNCKQPEVWSPAINNISILFAINSPARMAAFLAQVGHESESFNRLEEGLNYSADGLANTWKERYAKPNGKGGYLIDPKTKRHLPNDLALSLHRKPKAIANSTYGNRMGNGPPESGDGYLFRGRGLIMLTGKSNYLAAQQGTSLPLVDQPDLLLQPEPAARSAGWFWQSRGCNELADCAPGQDDTEDFERITKIVNGGTIGLEERIKLWKQAKTVLGA